MSRLFSEVEEAESLNQYAGQGTSKVYIGQILSDVNSYRQDKGRVSVNSAQLTSKLKRMAADRSAPKKPKYSSRVVFGAEELRVICKYLKACPDLNKLWTEVNGIRSRDNRVTVTRQQVQTKLSTERKRVGVQGRGSGGKRNRTTSNQNAETEDYCEPQEADYDHSQEPTYSQQQC